MRNHLLLGALGGVLLAGCGSPVCDKNESLDWAAKQGDCGGDGRRLLDSKSACSAGLGSCNGNDQKALEAVLDCLSKLPVCSSADQASWSSSRQACYDQGSGLSDACRGAFFGGALPGQDGGSDGGEADAGRQPSTDGGGALNLVVVADEANFALAWTSSQPGAVAKWEVSAETAVGVRYPERFVEANQWTLSDPDAGASVKKSYFVAGLGETDQVVMGEPVAPDAGSGADAGGCSGPLDCPLEKVCNLGACVEQSCQSSNTCPGGYLCDTTGLFRCVRIFGGDAGSIGPGPTSDAGTERPLPFVSEKVTVTTGAPGFSPEIFVSPFVARNPDIVAIDSARQYIALEQESQLFGHLSIKRGADYPLMGARKASQIDSIGTHVRLAYQPAGGTLFACYNVGAAVRVRRSRDLGQTWGGPTEAVDIANAAPADGGVAPLIQDCDIAPWRDGKAVMVMVDDSNLTIRTVSDNLALGVVEPAFVSSGPTAGNVYNAQRPTIATLPEDSIIHIGFTATRSLPAGTDTEVYGVYRDPTTGGNFTQAVRLNETGVGTGNPFPQDHVSLATDPVSKRALAAFTSLESQGGVTYNTVYVSLFNKTTKKWGTASDLSVFNKNATGTEFHVIPDREINSAWDAFSPTVAVTPNGKIFVSFIAGPQIVGSAADYHGYLVPFDLTGVSPGLGPIGWFSPPAKKLGATRVVDPRAGGNSAQPTRSASAADSQLSVYTVYVEGIGASSDEPNRAVMVTRP